MFEKNTTIFGLQILKTHHQKQEGIGEFKNNFKISTFFEIYLNFSQKINNLPQRKNLQTHLSKNQEMIKNEIGIYFEFIAHFELVLVQSAVRVARTF